jgi:glycosyltransferase involved in cell wall biosynthesis
VKEHPRILVVTVVHRPDDARILHRQIAYLRAEGFEVTYAAPWSVVDTMPPVGLRTLDLPRATARNRLSALVAARDLLRRSGPDHDIILVHDPELLLAVLLAGHRRLPPVVWDVHEHTAAALGDRAWVPSVLRSTLARAVGALERWAERNAHLILAEDGYRSRFRRAHPVVRNHPWSSHRPDPSVPVEPDDPPRVLYVGRISRGRGVGTMLEVARQLGPAARVELAGPVDVDVRADVEAAHADGSIVWHGFVQNDEVPALLRGASVGLSLLGDDPNYRVSMPTKVLEYLAHGVPVIATPLPEVEALIRAEGGGLIVPFDDTARTLGAVQRILLETGLHEALVAQAFAAAARRTWEAEGAVLADALRKWSA